MSDLSKLVEIGLRNQDIANKEVILQQMVGSTIDNGTINQLKKELKAEKLLSEKAKQEAEFYKSLLAQPMHVIASSNEDFKKTYEVQQELLASWIVSQRAFKELAIDLGLELGKTKQQVIDEGTANKGKVLNDQTKHGNDTTSSPLVEKYAEKLKAKLKKT